MAESVIGPFSGELRWLSNFWGQRRGKGQNNLGKLLMKIREALR